MAGTVVNNAINTIINAHTAGFTAGMQAVQGSAGMAMSAVTKMSGVVGMLGAALGGFSVMEIGKKIIEIGDHFENARTQVAGFLTALGMTGDFTGGLKTADAILRRITIDTAKLPITAEDAIEVFKSGMAVVSKATGMGTSGITAFTNKFTAVAHTLGVDAGTASMDIQKMLNPGAGTAVQRSPLVRTMLIFINRAREMRHQSDLTAASFNQLSSQQRFKAMSEAMALMDPMLKEMQNSWQAQSTALASNTKLIFRMASSPLFETMKTQLAKVNDLLLDSNGQLTPLSKNLIAIGQTISKYLIGGFEQVMDIVSEITSKAGSLGDMLMKNPGFRMIGQGLSNIGGAAKTLAGSVKTNLAEPSGVAVATAANPLDVLGKRFLIFTQILDPAAKILGTLSGFGKDLFQTFVQLQDAVNIVLQPIFAFGAEMISIYNTILTRLRPAFQQVQTAFSHLWHSGAKVLSPAIRILGAIVAKGAKIMGTVLVPILSTLAKVIAWVIERFSDLLDWIGKKLEKYAPKDKDLTAGPSVWDDISNTFNQLMDDLNKKEEEPSAGATGVNAPAAAGVYQDFRGSKFDITQKFAEGFDPDRIAVAFAQDVGSVGEQKLQSGHEPLFGVR